jgi:hypothetical protein
MAVSLSGTVYACNEKAARKIPRRSFIKLGRKL